MATKLVPLVSADIQVSTSTGAILTEAGTLPGVSGNFLNCGQQTPAAGAAVAMAAVAGVKKVVIAPLFNTFTPLPDGELRQRIDALARKLDFRTRGIFVVDSSRRSRHSNAYFTGLGRVKRIVLYDTLVAQMSEDDAPACRLRARTHMH